MKQNPTASVLEQIRSDWLARGWNFDDLRSFRMEGEGTGGEGGNGNSGEGGNADPPKGDPPKDGNGNTISQAEMRRIAAREKAEGKQAAERAIADQLGVSIEEAKRIITAAKADEDKQKTEAQRAKEAADSEKAAAEKDKQDAKLERHQASVERALIRALPNDLDDDALDKRVARLSKLIEVEVGADADTIKAAVTQLKTEMPELFPTTGTGPRGGANGDPKGGPPKDKPKSEDAYSRGLERAKGTASSGGYPIMDQLNLPTTTNSA